MSYAIQRRRDTRANCEAATPLDGEIWVDQTLKTSRIGDGSKQGGHLAKKWGKSFTLAPAQITSNKDDYNPTDLSIAETLYLDLDADRVMTGLAGGETDREICIVNGSAFRLTLSHQNASSSANNRFALPGAADLVVRPLASIRLLWKATLSRWVVSGAGAGWLGVTDLSENVILSGDLTPAQLAANTNNYNPAGLSLASRLRLSTDASRNLTGLAGGVDGRVFVIVNVDVNPLVLKNADTNSTAANRFDFGADVTLGAQQVAIIQYDGTDSRWKLIASTAGAAVADGAVTAVKLAASARAGNIVNGKVVESHTGNAVTIAIKTLAGTDPTASDPVYVRVADQAGAYTWMTLTAATSIVLSSGSSAGSTNGAALKLWLLAINDAGTFRLGLVNCAVGALTVLPLNPSGLISSTAEGGAGAADAWATVYTGTAVTNKPYTPLAYLEWQSGLTTAGNWDASPTIIGLWREGVPLPGTIIFRSRGEYTTYSSLTTAIPYDNTVPQISEGTEILALTVAAQYSNSLILLDSNCVVAGSNSPSNLLAALFANGASSAIRAGNATAPAASYPLPLPLNVAYAPGAVSAQIYALRIGPEAGTLYINGNGGGQRLNGSSAAYLDIKELVR